MFNSVFVNMGILGFQRITMSKINYGSNRLVNLYSLFEEFQKELEEFPYHEINISYKVYVM